MNDPFAKIAAIYDRLHWGAGRTAFKILSMGDFKNTDEVLDLGGGTGRVARFFIGRVRRVVVADLSAAMLQACAKRGLECVRVEGAALPFADGSFDKVIVVDALHHMEDKVGVLKEIHRVLKPAGSLILEEFNPETLFGSVIKYFEKIFNFGSQFLPIPALMDLLKAGGFNPRLYSGPWGAVYLIAVKQ